MTRRIISVIRWKIFSRIGRASSRSVFVVFHGSRDESWESSQTIPSDRLRIGPFRACTLKRRATNRADLDRSRPHRIRKARGVRPSTTGLAMLHADLSDIASCSARRTMACTSGDVALGSTFAVDRYCSLSPPNRASRMSARGACLVLRPVIGPRMYRDSAIQSGGIHRWRPSDVSRVAHALSANC